MKIPSLRRSIVFIIVLTCIEISLVGYIGVWRAGFWTAVQARNMPQFFLYIGYFSVAALGACFVSGYSQYIQNYTALISRYKLSRRAFKIKHEKVEGQSQRIQEDCFSYPALLISLLTGTFRNSCLLVVYVIILMTQISYLYLLYPIIYATIGTFIASKLASPLVNLNYINQVFEAKFRQSLTKLNYGTVHRNNINLFKVTKRLSYFQYLYNQVTVIVPYLVLFPIYFIKAITFGVFMQCAASMTQIIECMSYMINSFNDINKWLSCRKRLKELEIV